MTDKITGYTELTPYSLTTGAAVLCKDFDIATDTVATMAAKVISSTSGGVEVSIENDGWSHDIDGLPENTVGMWENESFKPTVKATLAEVGDNEVLALALGACTVTTPQSPTGYKLLVPDHETGATDYPDNITAITMTKQGKALFIQILNPLSTDGFALSTKSKEGGGIEVTWTGNYNPLELDTPPIRFYTPVYTAPTP